jgi:hypothetical protein
VWREGAARRATIVVAIVIVLACVVWALLAQTLVTPASAGVGVEQRPGASAGEQA